MNFLAHIYLSGNNPEIQIGNFIGDYVKGKKYENYPDLIQKGILLHRKIDDFTDRHPKVKKSSELLKENYGRYSGVIVDLYYDHFLAANWEQFSNQTLRDFVTRIHRLFLKNYFRLPGEVKSFLPFMIQSRRLENYKSFDGLEKALTIMTNYTSIPPFVSYAMSQLDKHYDEFHNDFFSFFEEVKQMALSEINGYAFKL